MFFRIAIAVLALLSGYIIYDLSLIAMAKHSAHKAEAAYIQGAEDADLTLVEFLDYGCGACQDLHPRLTRALERDGNVRYIIKPLPGNVDPNGPSAAKLLYAAGMQGKFAEAHNLLITNFRAVDDEYVSTFAANLALDEVRLRSDMDSEAVAKQLEKNFKDLKNMKGRFIPALLVNGDVLVEVADRIPTSDELLSLFNRARTL